MGVEGGDMVPFIVWGAYEAWKLLQPVAQRIVADADQGAATWTEKKATEWLKHVITPATAAPRPPRASGNGTANEVTGAAEDAIVTALNEEEATAEDLRRVAEEALKIDLAGAEVVTGPDAWFVSAYEALLWRAAVMAGWEGRPIAIVGALQGPEWLTVCVPRQPLKLGVGIDPSSLWDTTSNADVLRPSKTAPPADFFVRRTGESETAAEAAARVNEWSVLIQTFDPDSAGPGGELWRRIDGLSRKWVRFKWDDAVKKYAQKVRSPAISPTGNYLFAINLTASPPKFHEFPEEWRQEMLIPNEAAAIGTLSEGLDAYAAASEATLAAAVAILNRPTGP
jgi:hypothetical protein